MNSLSRRKFLQSAAATGVGSLASASLHASDAKTSEADVVHGTLIGVGFGAKRLSSQPASGSSLMTELNLANGTSRSAVIPIPFAHTLLALGQGPGLCLPQDGATSIWLDAKLEAIERMEAPNGYLFSGHGVLTADGQKALVSLRRKDAKTFADTGRIAVIDLSTRKFLGAFNSGGVRPHDMVQQGKTIIVSHYGDINYEQAGRTAENLRQPRLVKLDIETGRILQVINTPVSGSLTHFALGKGAQVCAVPLNYQAYDEGGRRAVEASLGGKSFQISVAEELEGRIATPMPILMLDRDNGTVKELRGEPEKQRRAQSVAFHQGSGRFFITYTFSDVLACVDDSGVRYVSSFDLGLSFVRGVCAIPNSKWIAVTGEFRGVAIVDAHRLKLVKRLDVAWYDNAHVQYRD